MASDVGTLAKNGVVLLNGWPWRQIGIFFSGACFISGALRICVLTEFRL